MQKSFLLVLGAFVVAALIFVTNEDKVKNDKLVTKFELNDKGIKVSSSLADENLVITNDEIARSDIIGQLENIEPAAGEEISDKVANELDTKKLEISEEISLEKKVTDVVNDVNTKE